jgi:hypothetical protein
VTHATHVQRRSVGGVWLLLQAGLALAAVKAALRIWSLQRVLRVVDRVARPHATPSGVSPELIAWSVKRVSPFVRGGRNCLVRALAAQLLLARRGCSAHLRIGFARSAQGQLEGHAWLRCDGRVLIGDEIDLNHFTPIPDTRVDPRGRHRA